MDRAKLLGAIVQRLRECLEELDLLEMGVAAAHVAAAIDTCVDALPRGIPPKIEGL